MSADASHNVSKTVEESYTADFSLTITGEGCTADPNDPGVSVWQWITRTGDGGVSS